MSGGVGDLAGAIEAARGVLSEVDAAVHAAADSVGGARELLRKSWSGSVRAEAATALVALGAALGHLNTVVQAVSSATDDLGGYVGHITGGAPVTIPQKEAPRTPSREEPAPFHRRFLDRLPVPTRGDAPTDGVLTSVDGVHIDDMTSGERGPGRGGPGLRERFGAIAVATDHAEGHAAAIMRARRIRNATLYINNEVCTDRPYSCDRVLPYVLPFGYSLTVYGPGGVPRVYIGNGRGVVE